MFEVGSLLEITLETDTAPWRVFGTFQEQNDEYIKVRGTLDDSVGKEISVPKSRIKLVTAI